MLEKFYRRYEEFLGSWFESYGGFVSKHPRIILFACILLNIILAIGLINLNVESNAELLYTPTESQAQMDRSKIKHAFGDFSGHNFFQQSQTNLGLYGEVIFKTKDNTNILNKTYLKLIRDYDKSIRENIVLKNNKKLIYSDVCALRNGRCVITGNELFSSTFINNLTLNPVTYPFYKGSLISPLFGNVNVSDGVLKYASCLKLKYNLRQDTPEQTKLSQDWEHQFMAHVNSMDSDLLDMSYATSRSMDEEIDKNTEGDMKYFILTIILMIMYATFVLYSRNCVTQRQLMGLCGIASSILAILSSAGLASACGIELVKIVGVMPFLIIGVGLDDTFILLSGLADAPYDTKVDGRIKHMLRTSGVAITITSLTNVFAFIVGCTSVFLSVRYFCLYTGFAVLFCYVNQLGFFVPCLVLNERRISENKHCCTCRPVYSEAELLENGRSKCYVACCAGELQNSHQNQQSLIEKYFTSIVQKLISFTFTRILIIVIFLVFLGLSIWGAYNVRHGLEVRNIVSEDSYFYKFSTWNSNYFKYEIPVSFVLMGYQYDYMDDKFQANISAIMDSAKSHQYVRNDIEINWLHTFRESQFYDNSSTNNFTRSLKQFLSLNPLFQNDVMFEDGKDYVLASRFHVISEDLLSSSVRSKLMTQMRNIASSSQIPGLLAYSPMFVFYEQYVSILPSTLQSLGTALAAMFIITCIFMPHPLVISLVTLTMLMILIGVFGSMYFWGLSLSSITMLHLIVGIGFSVDFSAHICHGYVTDVSTSRERKVSGAIKRVGGPVFNGAMSSIIGILLLVFSKSYAFTSFFKLMFLVIVLGFGHAVLFLPSVLYHAGPLARESGGKNIVAKTKPDVQIPFIG